MTGLWLSCRIKVSIKSSYEKMIKLLLSNVICDDEPALQKAKLIAKNCQAIKETKNNAEKEEEKQKHHATETKTETEKTARQTQLMTFN